jgi:ribosomal protein L7/L12
LRPAEAKQLVEGAPNRVLTGSVTKKTAEFAKAFLEAAGAVVTVKMREPPSVQPDAA